MVETLGLVRLDEKEFWWEISIVFSWENLSVGEFVSLLEFAFVTIVALRSIVLFT